jgi:hypothetical protein
MVCTMRGPSTCSWKSGSCNLSATPASPPAKNTATAKARNFALRADVAKTRRLPDIPVSFQTRACAAKSRVALLHSFCRREPDIQIVVAPTYGGGRRPQFHEHNQVPAGLPVENAITHLVFSIRVWGWLMCAPLVLFALADADFTWLTPRSLRGCGRLLPDQFARVYRLAGTGYRLKIEIVSCDLNQHKSAVAVEALDHLL